MKRLLLKKDDGTSIGSVEIADTFLARLTGLMGRPPLPPESTILIVPCNGVHTFLMRFPLDLVFLDAGHRVVRIVRNVRPWRLVFGGRQAASVLEMTSGWLPEEALRPGDRVTLVPA